MKTQQLKKLALFCLFLSFHFCYLEWPPDHTAFIFQMEYSIFFEQNDLTNTFLHPAVLTPFIGQILVLVALFQKIPGQRLALAGLILMGLFVLLLLLIGILGRNAKIALSTVPFLLFAGLCIRLFWRPKREPMEG